MYKKYTTNTTECNRLNNLYLSKCVGLVFCLFFWSSLFLSARNGVWILSSIFVCMCAPYLPCLCTVCTSLFLSKRVFWWICHHSNRNIGYLSSLLAWVTRLCFTLLSRTFKGAPIHDSIHNNYKSIYFKRTAELNCKLMLWCKCVDNYVKT